MGDSREFAQVALRYGVLVTPGASMSADESHIDYLRIAYLTDRDSIREGMTRLARAWESYSAHHDMVRPLVDVMV